MRLAEHFAVGTVGCATLAPCGYMVSVHFGELPELAALHASVRIPTRDVEGEVALFVLGSSGREHAVARHLGDGEEFAVALDDFGSGGVVYGRSPLAWVGLYSGGNRLR